jgi:hypothetical protein
MVQKINVITTDDITGDDGAELVPFALGGTEYEIDLIESNADTLRQIFAPYIAAARVIKGPKRRPAIRPGRATVSPSNMSIREWARGRGIPVNERGRIPATVIAQYEGAMRGSESPAPPPEPGPSGTGPETGPQSLSGERVALEHKPRKPRKVRAGK